MKSVVVIGGGIAGAAAIKELNKRAKGSIDITLVEPKEYSELPFGVPRSVAAPEQISRPIRRNLADWLGVKQIRSRATELTDSSVTLENGETLTFDTAILATGSQMLGLQWLKRSDNQTTEAREAELADEHSRLKSAQRIAIVGGGPVGVELAGEIATGFPDKSVTLIHGADRLIPALSEGASRKAHAFLAGAGVDIRLGERVDLNAANGGAVTLSDGTEVEADVVYVSVGIRAQTGFVGTDLQGALNESGQFRVDGTLQVVGHPTLFAIGDINDIPEIKLGALAGRQAPVAARNAVKLLNGSALKSYRPMKGPMGFVTLGAGNGIGQLPFGRVDFMVRMKQKDFFAGRMLK